LVRPEVDAGPKLTPTGALGLRQNATPAQSDCAVLGLIQPVMLSTLLLMLKTGICK
jgi:hypothetical protein